MTERKGKCNVYHYTGEGTKKCVTSCCAVIYMNYRYDWHKHILSIHNSMAVRGGRGRGEKGLSQSTHETVAGTNSLKLSRKL